MFIKNVTALFALVFVIITAGCSQQETASSVDDKVKIGIMLSDVGLGDQSFSDSAFNGLTKARDELGILFDYRELKESETYEKGLTELVEEDHDIIVGLGFMVQTDLEKVAKKYPDQHFILIDAVSELENVTSITFKEDEGSFLTGVVAALATKSNKLGFIGGDDVPLINKFEDGFIEGAKSVNPSITVEVKYAGDFGNDQLGAQIARDMIQKDVDVLYAAAGFTGVGMLKEAQANKVLAIGVDTDQYFYAEKAVITSMLKKVDTAMYQLAEQLIKDGKISEGHIELGIKDNGIDLAPLRVVPFSEEQQQTIDEWKEKLISGS
ncbi:BMP family ABC transporter substrate-binding protein [Metabacillus litoralis]|uniref:BMP family lipoprotein n=1 Tax=Metabacillus TaxID=2675233 RepID=UPI001BA3A647|nr:BMP family ABC transporter substrate-binding protein [Metabacillus litoralis]UHA60291.1 BMP family ABC transporter substrate-binding protein [Metabacillus litoralis]